MTTNHITAACEHKRSSVAVAVQRALGSATLLAFASLAAGTAFAQEQQAAPAAQAESAQGTDILQEITVTGSRIARTDGYEAPTPVSVLGAEQLNAMATSTIADSVNRLPAFAGSQTPRNLSSNISSGTAGVNVLNLRGLGGNRTLVLQDGKRMVGSSLGTGGNASAVDVNSIPSGLVQRVEVVTGGASAVYGSDALAGVVNFILDKEFTGLKGTAEGGITQAGDGETYKFTLTGGTPFADGRGHLLFSGELADDRGIIGNDRSWADDGFLVMNNPDYVDGSGLPRYLTVHEASIANGTYGGLISTGPLKGIQFGQGGQVLPFNFGDPISGPVMSGGDWKAARIDRLTTIALPLNRRSMFGRASFDVSDNATAYVELQYSKTKSHNKHVVPNLNNGGVTIKSGNPFIPDSVQEYMDNNALASFRVGTLNGDMPFLQGINERELKRGVAGIEGNFDMIGTEWTWDAYYAHSEQGVESWTPGNRINANYNKAIDAVMGPLGAVVCAVNADADPTNDDPACVPYNPMGLNVNSAQAIAYVQGMGHSDMTLKQEVVAASMSGEPFSTWAGPVSIAVGAEHRRESVDGEASALDEADAFFAGNYHATEGKINVTEGFLETVVPLLKDVPMAQALDFNGAVRYTDYSTSGEVTTWKLGAVWTPIDDIRFRLTRSRDIRAPNLGEVFNKGQSGTGSTFDPVLDREYFVLGRTLGNPDLKPEEADTTGLGVVLAPRFIPGFTMSVDYYEIEIDGAMNTLSGNNIVNGCYEGNATLCNFITRDPVTNEITLIERKPANILGQKATGVDVDASYNLPLPVGDLRLRAVASFVEKLETYDATTIDGRGVNSDDGAIGLGTGLAAPKHRYMLSAGYNLDPVTVTLSMRGISSGVYNNALVECTTGCPDDVGINNNHIDGKEYFDLALNYKVGLGDLFFVIENLMNEDPASVAGGTGGGFYQGMSNVRNYDRFGRSFRAGVRFQF